MSMTEPIEEDVALNLIENLIPFDTQVLTTLECLPTEILERIFAYCNLDSLCQLWNCSPRLRITIENWFLHREHTNAIDVPLITNGLDNRFKNKCALTLDVIDKYRIAYNWRFGKFCETVYFKAKFKCMPHLTLESSGMWLSQRNRFEYLQYKRGGVKKPHVIKTFRDDIAHFVKAKDLVAIGFEDDGLKIFKIRHSSKLNSIVLEPKFTNSDEDVHLIDVSPSSFATYSKPNIQVWTDLSSLDFDVQPIRTYSIPVRTSKVCALRYAPVQHHLLAFATNGLFSNDILSIYDIERNVLSANFRTERFGEGILDIAWLNENCLLTCGYLSMVHLWDTRVNAYVRKWDEPYNSVLYCIQTDNVNSILCGTQDNAKITLWDMRQADFVQTYFATKLYGNSPVYSIDMDNVSFFAATDACVSHFDFRGHNNEVKDYRTLWADRIVA